MCLCFTEAPLESSHQLFEGVTVICNLHPELSDPKSGFSLRHVFMGCLLGRIQHAGGKGVILKTQPLSSSLPE